MAKVTLTTPFAPVALNTIKVQVINSLDLQAARMAIVLRIKTAGGANYGGDPAVNITNGICDTIIASVAQSGFAFGSANIPTAYDQVMAAIRGATAGNEELAILGVLVTLGIIPPGVAS